MKPRRKDLTGMVFGRLTALEFSHVEGKYYVVYWKCKCSCGKLHVTSARALVSGDSRSCGCLHAEVSGSRFSKLMLKHGHSKSNDTTTPEYRAWKNMNVRCYNLALPTRKHYGGRGINVCERWRNSFENFFADMGTRPSPKHTLDRFPDNNGNYEPGNCRWATYKEKSLNKRSNNMIECNGVTKSESEWCDELGVVRGVVRRRIAAGWSIERSVTTQVKKNV